MGGGPDGYDGERKGPTMPSILREDNTGAIFMAKNTAITPRTKHVDIRARFVNDMVQAKELSVEHIRSEENPSDCMTKNLPLALFRKHAALVCDGTFTRLHEPTNTEDVRSYCATVGTVGGIDGTTVRRDNDVELDSTTVPKYNCSKTNCSCGSTSSNVHQEEDLGWTIVGKGSKKYKIKT
jgi:hypothetical protein